MSELAIIIDTTAATTAWRKSERTPRGVAGAELILGVFRPLTRGTIPALRDLNFGG